MLLSVMETSERNDADDDYGIVINNKQMNLNNEFPEDSRIPAPS